jgi:TolB protein
VNPKYSPDGKKIVFECPKNIEKGDCGAPISLFIINSDGTGLHELFGDRFLSGIQPSWSPDGKKIVFISMGQGERTNYADIYICNSDGTEIKQLTNDDWQDGHPVFSPYGDQICYVSPRHNDFDFGKELFVINTDGTSMARVTPPYRRENAKGIFAKWAGDDYPQWAK